MSKTYISVYHVNQCYGGPEEGGWWYYAGILQPDLSRSFSSRRGAQRKAQKYLAHVQAIVRRENEGLPMIESVISEGQLRVFVSDEAPAPYYPSERPYYC